MTPPKKTRPWQAMMLFVMSIVAAVMSGIGAIFLLVLGPAVALLTRDPDLVQELDTALRTELAHEGMMLGDLGSSGLLGIASAVGWMLTGLGVVVLAIMILTIFFAVGYYRGWSWVPIVSMVFIGLLAALQVLALFSGDLSAFFGLLVLGMTGYFAWVCAQHPFFAEKK